MDDDATGDDSYWLCLRSRSAKFVARVLKKGRDLWLDGYIRVEHGEDEDICETNDYTCSPSSRIRQGVTRDVVGASNECSKWLES